VPGGVEPDELERALTAAAEEQGVELTFRRLDPDPL